MKKKLFLSTILSATLLALTSMPASAALTAPSGLGGPTSVGQLIQIVTNLLLFIAGSIAVIFIIVGAIQYSTSAGNEQSVQKAKSTITSAVVGLVISILALGIVNFIINTFT